MPKKNALLMLMDEIEELHKIIADKDAYNLATRHFLIATQSLLVDKGIITEEEINEKVRLLSEMEGYQ